MYCWGFWGCPQNWQNNSNGVTNLQTSQDIRNDAISSVLLTPQFTEEFVMFTYNERQVWGASNIRSWWQLSFLSKLFLLKLSTVEENTPNMKALCFVSNQFLFLSVFVGVLWGQLVNSSECWYDQQCSSCISYDSFWCNQHSTLQPARGSSWQGDLLPTVKNIHTFVHKLLL